MAVLALSLLVAGCEPPGGSGTADGKGVGDGRKPLGTVKVHKKGTRNAVSAGFVPQAAQDCVTIRAQSTRATPNCVVFDTKAAPSGKRAETKTVTTTAGDACTLVSRGQQNWLRRGYCFKDATMTYTQVDTRTRKPLGTGSFTVSGSLTLDPSSTTWTETFSVRMTRGSKAVRSLNIGLNGTCSGSCSMAKKSAWGGSKTLRPGGPAATGSVTYRMNPAKGQAEKTTLGTHIYVNQRGDLPLQPNISWKNDHQVRCDRAVGRGAGCVFPHVKPKFELSLAKYKAAAFTYQWAIAYMTGQEWGKGLRRMADESIAEKWRENICDKGPSPFKRMNDVVPNDSCDEFPFARTYESGGSQTVNSNCADVIPVYEDGEWLMYPESADKPVRTDAPCVRSHVTKKDNVDAGGELGRFAVRERVLDGDRYQYVAVK